jgi:hypothetical protein
MLEHAYIYGSPKYHVHSEVVCTETKVYATFWNKNKLVIWESDMAFKK